MANDPALNRTLFAKSSRGSARTLFLLLALVLAAGGLISRVRHRQPDPEDALHGDSDEALVALESRLKKTPPAEKIPLLLQYAAQESPGLRYAAVDALGRERAPEVADALEKAFLDSASLVRQRALETLPFVDKERGLRLLLAGLRDEDRWIREAAASQINAEAGRKPVDIDRRAVPMLIKALDDPSGQVVTLAAGTLRKLTGQQWRLHASMSPTERQAVLAHWKAWWKKAEPIWQVPAALADAPARIPTRTDPAPDFQLRDMDGKTISLEGQKGRLTLLNFWGSWCPPCKQEIPELVQLYAKYHGRNLDMIGIALDERDGAEGLRKWCREHGVLYPQALSTEAVTHAYGDIHEVPVSVLIDAKGRIRYRWEGDRDFGSFQATVERLLRE